LRDEKIKKNYFFTATLLSEFSKNFRQNTSAHLLRLLDSVEVQKR